MVFPYFGFSMLIACVLILHSRSVIVFLSVPVYLDLCTHVHTRVNRLWSVAILTYSTSASHYCMLCMRFEQHCLRVGRHFLRASHARKTYDKLLKGWFNRHDTGEVGEDETESLF